MPRFTAATITQYRPGKTRREIADTAARPLYLVIEPTGTKTFALRFRNPAGRPVKLTLGPLDISGREAADEKPIIGAPLSLLAARQLTSQINRERALGIDIISVLRRARLERAAGGSNTFSEACLAYTEQRLKTEVRRWQFIARLLGVVTGEDGRLMLAPKGLADRWRDRPVMDINSDDLHAIVRETREHGAPGLKRSGSGPSSSMARIMRAALGGLFAWMLENRRIKANPMQDVATPKASKARDRVLTDAEIKSFWNACDTLAKPVGACLKLLLLTGARLNEIAQVSRSEIDSKNHTITIPEHRSKNRLPHLIPLSSLARETLDSVKTNTDQVFTTSRGKPLAAWSRIKRELDSMMKSATAWTLHDLRRTFATHANEIGIEPHVVEACLNHVSGPSKSKIAGVYNRATYAAEKKIALQKWSDHVAALVGINVIPIAGQRARR